MYGIFCRVLLGSQMSSGSFYFQVLVWVWKWHLLLLSLSPSPPCTPIAVHLHLVYPPHTNQGDFSFFGLCHTLTWCVMNPLSRTCPAAKYVLNGAPQGEDSGHSFPAFHFLPFFLVTCYVIYMFLLFFRFLRHTNKITGRDGRHGGRRQRIENQ